ncbi:BatA domain-containing protein [candidate division KSB1 bacterium]|nr:BatA domain-containing protein [candidate division KSB1 bacterium]
MTFLNSAILFGLAAAAIPIIIHFLTRQKAKTIMFSSLRFLKLLEDQQIKRLKVKQVLLLIIRTLIILFIILAFARPTMKGSLFSGIGTTAETSAVIILDNSLSMGIRSGGELLYDKAKKAALDLEAVFNFGDEIYSIYSTTGTPALYEDARFSFETVSKIINKSRLSQNSTDLVSALLKAKGILEKSENACKEIYLITDLQETGIKEIEGLSLPLLNEDNFKLFVIAVNQKGVNNLVITEVQVANQVIEKGKMFEVLSAIKNVGTEPVRNSMVQVVVEGKRVAQTTVSLEPGESQTTSFKIIPTKTGLSHGSVLLEDDDLFYDNRRFFTFFVPEQVKVLLIGDRENDVRFLQLGLNPSKKNTTQILTDFKTPSQIDFSTLNKYQVLLLSNVSRIEGALLIAIENFIKNGGSIMVFPGNNVDLRHYNEGLNKKLFLPFFTETVGQIGSKKFNLRLGKIDFSHPIFSGVFQADKKQIESPKFFFLTKLKTDISHDVIIEYSNGEPFLLETSGEKGRTMIFTSAVDPAWSDLYLRGIFVPLIHRCVVYLANNTENETGGNLINDELTTSLTGIEKYENFFFQTPENNNIKVIPQISPRGVKIKFEDTYSAGTYSLYHKEKLIRQWAVNTNPEESNVSAMDTQQFKEIAGNCKILTYKNGSTLKTEIETTRYGKEFWKYFVVAVLILLVIEMILAREVKHGTEIRVSQ